MNKTCARGAPPGSIAVVAAGALQTKGSDGSMRVADKIAGAGFDLTEFSASFVIPANPRDIVSV